MAEASQLFSQKANDYRSGRTHYPKAIASILRALELPGNKAVEIILPSLIQRTGIIKKCAFAV